MGRIAEALKKAQRERDEQLRVGGVELHNRQGGVACPSAMPNDPVAPADSPDAPWRSTQRVDGIPGSVIGVGSPRELRWQGPQLSPMPPWEVDPAVIALRERSSAITEQYRAVRTWLLRRNTPGEHASIAITSSMPREGKTVTVANLAVVAAEVRHQRVLAVDCDFRRGCLANLFRLPNTPGLADVLAGRVTLGECISETPLGNLFILPAGACQDVNPAELINSTLAARVFDEIRDRYHCVLVDTPPVRWLSDVGVIGALCKGILLVVRMNKTSESVVQQSLHWLRSNNLNVLGCVAAFCSEQAARSNYRYRDKEG